MNSGNIDPTFSLDVNGYGRSAVLYSTISQTGTITITTNHVYNVYYNITAATGLTISLPASQASSNIGKYFVFRNNTGANLNATVTNAGGITSPITLYSNASATIMVTGTGPNYALF